MTKNVLEVSDLRSYIFTRSGVVRAVDGVSFAVGEEETLGIVGESGCGKTMTAHSILRMLPPGGRIVGGKVVLDGEDLLAKSEREMQRIRGSKLSMILQDPLRSLNPVFAVGDQVGEAIRIHQRIKGAALVSKTMDALRMVRISSPEVRMHDYPHQMSGGMRQRVAGSIALSCQPRMLIADEPTSSLDVTIQVQFLALLKDLQRALGTALILITHDFGVVARMCDAVIVMYAGQVVESASVLELFDHPSHPYTVALLKCLPRLDAKLGPLGTIDGQPPSLLDPRPGCRFAPRCPEAVPACEVETAPAVLVGQRHYVKCWRRKPRAV